MKMVDIFIIMGGRNTKKSATIRALTGVFKRKNYKVAIETRQGNIDVINVFVQISSLQESRISPQDFINQIKQNGYLNVLVSLWISSSNGQPDGITYIQEFISVGWNIREIVVLGTNSLSDHLPTDAPAPNFIPNSRDLPANQVASQIRRLWQWL